MVALTRDFTFGQVPHYEHFRFALMIIARTGRRALMSESKKIRNHKLQPGEYEPYVDGIGITRFLPPKHCKNCED